MAEPQTHPLSTDSAEMPAIEAMSPVVPVSYWFRWGPGGCPCPTVYGAQPGARALLDPGGDHTSRRGQPEVTTKVGGTKIVQAFRSAIVSLHRLSSVASTKAKLRSGDARKKRNKFVAQIGR